MRVPPRASPAEADKEIRRNIPMPVKAMCRIGGEEAVRAPLPRAWQLPQVGNRRRGPRTGAPERAARTTSREALGRGRRRYLALHPCRSWAARNTASSLITEAGPCYPASRVNLVYTSEVAEMARVQFGRLTEAWKGEAADFTPLLAEQMDAVGAAIGVDLT